MIEIHQLGGSGEIADLVIGRLTVEKGEVVAETDPDTATFLESYECVGPDGERLTFADGEPWLDALPANLRGSHLWAARA